MSDKPNERATPLTDAQAFSLTVFDTRRHSKSGEYASSDFARALERHAEALAERLQQIASGITGDMLGTTSMSAREMQDIASRGIADWQAFRRAKVVVG